jgi:hypothetical protein
MIALARKYRPKRFADLVSQDHIAAALRGAVALGRVAHGFLFAGPRAPPLTRCPTSSKTVSDMLRNRCPTSAETGVRLGPKYAASRPIRTCRLRPGSRRPGRWGPRSASRGMPGSGLNGTNVIYCQIYYAY